jgi:MFS superfamily sulfate permease-like transporter
MNEIWPLLFGAIGIMLVSFCSMMTTARGFAAKNHYSINVNQDMAALGACDIVAGVGQGFVVSGADSRTAVADSSGGKSQMTGIVAAIVMAAVLMFFTAPLGLLPTTALAAILISSAMGLFDFRSIGHYYRQSKPEFRHSVIAMLGVMTVGVLPGVLVAVTLAILNLLRMASHPKDAELGLVEGETHVWADNESEGGKPIPGMIIYRFHGSIVFFNADYLRDRVHELVKNADPKPEWFLFDAEACSFIDITGVDTVESLQRDLSSDGIVFAVARASGAFRFVFEHSGLADKIGPDLMFPTIQAGADAFRSTKAENKNEPTSKISRAA